MSIFRIFMILSILTFTIEIYGEDDSAPQEDLTIHEIVAGKLISRLRELVKNQPNLINSKDSRGTLSDRRVGLKVSDYLGIQYGNPGTSEPRLPSA